MQPIKRDSLRYVLMMAANKGLVSTALREWDFNHSTVRRRINIFQETLLCRIFEHTAPPTS